MAGESRGLLELLVDHGVPERGTRVYLVAARGGPQSASELARAAGLSRVSGYRVIDLLVEAGLLVPVGRRPQRFQALPMGELVDRWISSATDRLRRLERDRDKLLSEFEDHRTQIDEGDPRRFHALEGREEVHRFLRRRFGAAQKEILVSVSGSALSPALDGGMDRALSESVQRGATVRLVTEITPANLFEAKHFASALDVRHAIVPVAHRAIVIDRCGTLIYVAGQDGFGATDSDQIAIWSTAPTLVHLAREYHRRLWAHAVPAATRIVEVENPPAAVSRLVLGKEREPFRPLADVARLGLKATGLNELKLDLPVLIEDIARQFGRQIAASLEGTTPKEVARSLVDYYSRHAVGELTLDRERPLTFRVRNCFACLPQSPEVGRVLCPGMIGSVLESRTGMRWEVSKPDPRRHERHGCLFVATPA